MALTTESALRKDKTNAFASTMEHRHFATIAAILAELKPSQRLSLSATSWRYVCNLFADRLAGTNPRFDRQRFLKACGVE
jgi:prephenate dehydrogenase